MTGFSHSHVCSYELVKLHARNMLGDAPIPRQPHSISWVVPEQSTTKFRMEPKIQSTPTGKARDALVKILDHVLRDECSLSARIRDYRWKLIGPNLYSLQAFR